MKNCDCNPKILQELIENIVEHYKVPTETFVNMVYMNISGNPHKMPSIVAMPHALVHPQQDYAIRPQDDPEARDAAERYIHL